MSRGVVAAGHAKTAEAAAEVLRDGGNAFDAVLAGLWASTVAEPILSSLGGGGFLLAEPTDGSARVYDFFVQTPQAKCPTEDLEFKSVLATFNGGVTQEFHVGVGAVTTPGMIPGLFAIHNDLASLPMAQIAAPAVALARDGLTINRFQAYLATIVEPILTFSPECRSTYCREDGTLRPEGDLHHQPALAETIASLAEEGEGLFRSGEIGARLVNTCTEFGGHLTEKDLTDYRVETRKPLSLELERARVLINPGPSAGGTLVAFGLEMLRDCDLGDFGSEQHLTHLTRALDITRQARRKHGATTALLEEDVLAEWRSGMQPLSRNGTTHLSVIDAQGNAASATVSNGSSTGRMIPDTGILLNNMLGEEDLCPDGFHQWPTDTRVASMMAPCLIDQENGWRFALGSGGSNRIRSAILQSCLNLIELNLSLDEAVAAPRLHLDRERLDIEPGFDAAVLDKLTHEQKRWKAPDMFFGGVHAVGLNRRSGELTGAGDPRRDGCHVVVEA